jgi:hypothetical protein
MYSFSCVLSDANDLQVQVLLGLVTDAVGYRYMGSQLTDDVRWYSSSGDG